jgi:hypothetical protein
LIVRPANTVRDIEKVYNFATDAFGNTAFPLEQLKDWHERYPEGRRSLCDGDLLLRAISACGLLTRNKRIVFARARYRNGTRCP